MSHTADSRRDWLAAIARNSAISISVGVALVFLVLLSRQDLWGWRLALWGGLGGLLTYLSCHFLDATVGDRIRRRELLPGKLVGVPLYSLGGCFGELAATSLLKALKLLPFRMSGRDWRISLLVGGGDSIVIGLLFYSFRLLRRRLQESVERIKEQEFAEKELVLARSIQSRLLPPQELAGPGYRVAARNLAARFVAGDFYDIFEALARLVPPLDGEPPGVMLDRLSAAVREATQPTLEDDWTALVLEARTSEPP